MYHIYHSVLECFLAVNMMTIRPSSSYLEDEYSKICLRFLFILIYSPLIFDEIIFIPLVQSNDATIQS